MDNPLIVPHTLTIRKPDDWHVHFRDEPLLADTVPATAQHFQRALVMPNLKPALTTLTQLLDYRTRILAASPNKSFVPYMTLYLNETINPDVFQQISQHDFILGAKLYPAGVTTHAEQGAQSIEALYPYFEIMQDQSLVLQVHGESLQGDIFEREALFIETHLRPLLRNFPKLRVVLEHISTRHAVDFVLESTAKLAATLTPHHLLYNRNQLLGSGLKPHYYCLPILKHADDQAALIQAAVSGHPKFFAGTDSAPHPQEAKESACGCAGIFSAPYAVCLYAEIFEKENQLTRLNAFLSEYGADFYEKPYNKESLTLQRIPQQVPLTLPLGTTRVIPVAAGETLPWSIV